MIQLLESTSPWFVDLLQLGGPILTAILIIAAAIWAILTARLYHLFLVFPIHCQEAYETWRNRKERVSWFAQQQRADLVSELKRNIDHNFSLVGTLIKICPLLGLLGTVLGMLEVFDALAATGSNNPRSMAAGVSKATVSTLAGMNVAIFALLGKTLVERKAASMRSQLDSLFESGL